MASTHGTLLDALVLLDAFARERLPDYDGSEIEQRVSATIEKVARRVRDRTKVLVPLKGQMILPELPPRAGNRH